MIAIDINCDLGEGQPNDEGLMKYISSANIACGGHTGDINSVRKTIELAVKNNVAVGAHPSYPDKENFGRKSMKLSANDLYASIHSQLSMIAEVCREYQISLHHLKPHGALYNDSAVNTDIAKVIVDVILDFGPDIILYGLAESCLIYEANRLGIKTAAEAFADRAYLHNKTLAPRHMHGALITDKNTAAAQAFNLAVGNEILSLDGMPLRIPVDTICIHGDNSSALEIAKAIYSRFSENNIAIKPI
jgi:UPF0271 protein